MLDDSYHMLDTNVTDAPWVHRASRETTGSARPARSTHHRSGAIAIPEDAALVLVGMQRAYEREWWGYWSGGVGVRNNTDAESVAARLLTEWRATGRPVIHVRHLSASATSPLRARAPGADFNPLAEPRASERVYQKRHGSAFVETTLAADLGARRVRTIVLAGLTTDHSVSSTARSAIDLGFTAFVVSDATATFDREGPDGRRFPAELMHNTALASLQAESALVLSSALVLEGVALAAM